MIAKLKKLKKNESKVIRTKLERLSTLASEFLEKSFSYESLVDNWAEMERLKSILVINLWQGKINPEDIDWCLETNEDSAKMILYYHKLLTEGFWNKFKQELKLIKASKGPTIIPDEYAGLEIWHFDAFIKVEIPDNSMTVRFIWDSDKIEFMRSSVEAIPLLLELLQELPMDNLRFCENAECDKFIVKTTGKEKKFCSGTCQSAQYQRDLRQKQPEQHKQYHRKYYKIIKERKNKAKSKCERGDGQL
ncbi:MAG TPA: hypothetical protein PLA72_11220 [Smithellaceae bacterium]|nr:hypothetical protein [Smithellaceae bacterium]